LTLERPRKFEHELGFFKQKKVKLEFNCVFSLEEITQAVVQVCVVDPPLPTFGCVKKGRICVRPIFFGDGGIRTAAWVFLATPLLPTFNVDNWWLGLKKPKLEFGSIYFFVCDLKFSMKKTTQL